MKPSRPTSARPFLAVLLALLAAAGAADAQTTINETKIFSNAGFPSVRPPLFDFRKLSSATHTCTRVGNGWTLTVTHQELPRVTAAMMQWFFQNLATGSAKHPADGVAYPMFVLMHPRDHIKHTSTTSPTRNGASTTWIEFPLTSCTQSGADWTCASGADANPGYLDSSPVASWQKVDQINGTSTLQYLNTRGAKFLNKGCNEYNQCAWVTWTQHSWSWVKATNTLKLKTVLRIGIGNPTIDTRITTAWANGLDPEVKCRRTAQHYVEEYGTLPLWLPAHYNITVPAKPGRRG